MAAPPSLNLLGEIGILSSLVSWSLFLMFILYFCSAAYTLYIYSYSQRGSVYSGLYSYSLVYVRDFWLLHVNWFPLNFIILTFWRRIFFSNFSTPVFKM